MATTFSAVLQASQEEGMIKKCLPYLILLVICFPALTLHLKSYPPIWFDEGYKANAARTLAEHGVYGTYTIDGYVPFDPGMSSGPAEIIPIALVFKLFGVGIAQARMVIVTYTLLALISFFLISKFIYGRRAGLFITLIMLVFPALQGISFLLVGRQILGEGPALALILLGLWLWFQSWENQRWLFVGLTGLALGLGVLSKTQIGIALVPTLLLVAAGRSLLNRKQALKYYAPLAILVGTVGLWILLGRLAAAETVRQESSNLLLDAVRSNLITGLFGRTLTSNGWIIFCIMGLSAAVSGWRLRSELSSSSFMSSKQWAELTITLFVLFTALWFAFLSVGWPRYAYAGLVLSLMLWGGFVWDKLEQIRLWFDRRWPGTGDNSYKFAAAVLALAVILINVYSIVKFEQDTNAQGMADFISAEISRDAVIESWEWELDALSSHWEYHHPDQEYLFLAIRQFSHEQKPFELEYDLLQADPDYLVSGPFSKWTAIYDETLVRAEFTRLRKIGVYEVWKRRR